MSTSPVPLSQINFNPLRQPGTPLALMYGGSVAGSLLSAMSGNPLAALVSEAIQNLQSSIDAINRVLNAAPVLQSLLLNSADIGVLNVASLYGPGQLGVYQGPPSFPLIGWIGSEAAPFQSPTTTITSTTAGTITTSSAHGLAVNQVVQILGTSNVAQNGFWAVATVPSGTTFTVAGFSGSSTGGTVQRVLVGGWLKTLAVGGSSYLNALTTGLFADENGNLTVNAATVKGILSAATVLAGSLNITIILVTGLVLTNNSPSAGNIAWSACTVEYQGTAYAISSGDTGTSKDTYVTWTVGATTFSHSSSYTPGQTIFLIATNNGGTADLAWNKVGAIHVQAQQLQPVLTYDGPNGSLIISNVTFSDNTPSAGSVQWSACQVTYQGTTYSIPSGSSDSAHPAIIWKLSSPNQFQAVTGQTLGADDFLIGNNTPSGSPSSSGFFNRVTRFGDRTNAYTSVSEVGIVGFNKNQNATFSAQRQAGDGAVGAAGNIIVFDGTGSGSQVQVGMTGNIANGGGAVGGMIYTRPCTFAQLPTNAIQGDQAVITDGFAAVPAFTNTATGGGTTIVPVYFDGAQWRYG